MLQNLLVSINTVGPIFILLGIGYFLKRKEIINDNFIKTGNKIVYNFALPCTMFKQIYNANFDSGLNYIIMIYVIIALFLLTLIISLITPLFIKDKRRCGAFVQNSFRSNFVLLGTVMAINLFGEEGAVSTILLVPAGVLMLTTCSIVVLTVFSPSSDNKKINFGSIMLSIIKNPVIISIALGFIVKFINIQLPTLMTDSVNSMSALATPLALLALGAEMKFSGLKNMKAVFACCAVKLLAVPIVAMLPALFFFNFTGFELGALFFIFCAPAGISNYSLTYSMGSDYEFTGQVIVISSLLSFFTMVIGIFLFVQSGVFIV